MRDVVFLYRPIKYKDDFKRTFYFNVPYHPSFFHKLIYFREIVESVADVVANDVSWSTYYYPSVLLRCHMQVAIVAQYAPYGRRVLSTNHASWIRNSIVILHKGLMGKFELIENLRKRNNIIIVDIVDEMPSPQVQDLVDGIICCSRKGYAYYKHSYSDTPIFFVEHCVDPRLPELRINNERFKACYVGAPENLLMFDSVKDDIDVKYTQVLNGWMDRLWQYTFHYALRPLSDQMVFKPFTKGFIAAKCASNILVHKDDGDAASYLGDDYPYLIKEDLTESVVKSYIDKARDDFGGNTWNKALAIMENLRECIRPATISKQFWDMIVYFDR